GALDAALRAVGERPVKPKPTVAAKREPTPEPAWVKPTLLALAAILLLTWFTGEIGDTDFWLHLMTGRHTLEHRALTVPDPFSYTSSINSPAFPNESKTRYFNLTHEWLAQIVMYLIHSAFGFPGMVLARALLLMAFCGLVGLMVWWRTAGFYRSLAAVIAAGAGAGQFFQRPALFVIFLFLPCPVAPLGRRRGRVGAAWGVRLSGE